MRNVNTEPTVTASPIEEVTKLLFDASEAIGETYFNFPVAEPDQALFRERVYCYELYHQWRSRWPERYEYSLCGETDKRGHWSFQGKFLQYAIPDFLVHRPGEMNSVSNLLVMEVKRAKKRVRRSKAQLRDMLKDLAKLTAFRRALANGDKQPANYQYAFFWVCGIGRGDWPTLRNELKTERDRNDVKMKLVQPKDVDCSLIRFFVHEQANEIAEEVSWGQGGE